MEDANVIVQLINVVGFPIAVCLILFWFIKTYLTRIVDTLEKNNTSLDKLSNEFDKLTTELKNRGGLDV